jgi:hypothetical protein
MVFYYYSFFGVLLILLVYALGGALLGALWFALRKWKRAWILMLPLFALLLILPWAEELWIAWNFGRLCSKDAGTFVYRTADVDGFYDETHGWRPDKLRTSGYRWVEGQDNSGSKPIYWRHEWMDGEIHSSQIDHPTARYHYLWTDRDTRISYKVERIERAVVDTELKQTLARETKYRRAAPWFYVSLDRPAMLCPAPGVDPLEKSGSVFNLALKPTHN